MHIDLQVKTMLLPFFLAVLNLISLLQDIPTDDIYYEGDCNASGCINFAFCCVSRSTLVCNRLFLDTYRLLESLFSFVLCLFKAQIVSLFILLLLLLLGSGRFNAFPIAIDDLSLLRALFLFLAT